MDLFAEFETLHWAESNVWLPSVNDEHYWEIQVVLTLVLFYKYLMGVMHAIVL